MSFRIHPFVIVSGSEEFFQRNFLREYIKRLRETNWEIDIIDGQTPGSLESALSSGVFFSGSVKRAFHVVNPDKISLDFLRKYSDKENILILDYPGDPKANTKWGKFVKENKKFHRAFPKPKPWDRPKQAINFLNESISNLGKNWDNDKLPAAIVNRVGDDLGFLSFELKKIDLLSGNSSKVTIEHVKGALAEISDAEILQIFEALSVRNKKKLARSLSKVFSTSKNDPTMAVCRILGAKILIWFQARCLDQVPPKEAAEELGINPWYFKNKILPPVKNWNLNEIKSLIKELALSERAVLQGHTDPWLGLCSRLLCVC